MTREVVGYPEFSTSENHATTKIFDVDIQQKLVEYFKT